MHNAGLHPALALVFIVPFLPHAKREVKHFFEQDLTDRSTLASFEHEWKIVVDFGLFMFGLANSGVEFSSAGTVTWLVLSALIIGKAAGIFSLGYLAEYLGFKLPHGMVKRDLLVAGVICGTGFTVALFVSGEAFSDPVIKGAAKMGAMFSIVAVGMGIVCGILLGVQKRE
jgi:NhaA family Na+:H+ antiporter